jgi:hypothetical protein
VNRHGLAADDDEVHVVAIQAGAEGLEVGLDLEVGGAVNDGNWT